MKLLRLTDKGEKFIRTFMGRVKSSNNFRAHNLQLTLYLSRIPPYSRLVKNTAFEPFSNKRYKGLKTELLGARFFWYGGQTAILYLPDVFGDGRDELLKKINDSYSQIERVLKDDFEIETKGFRIFKLNSAHIALIANNLKVRGYYKMGRWALDFSHKKSEIETESLDTAFEDIEKLRNFKGGIKQRNSQLNTGQEDK